MKMIIKTIAIFLVFVLILPLAVAQQAQESNDPGVTPDSFFWGLDKAIDQLSLLLTFDKGEKARKGLEVARERLLEVKLMIEENKLDAADKANDDHGKNLLKVKESVKELEKDDSLEEIKELIEIEKELEEHDDDVEETFGELKVKIEVEGEITQQQRNLIESILSSLQGQSREIEIEIKNKKNKIKIEIEQETGKSEQEIEIEIKDIEKEQGIKKQEKAIDAISDAEEELSEFLKEAEEEGIVVSPEVLDQFNSLLEQARIEFANLNFIEARQLAKQAENLLDLEEEEFEEKEIEVEIEDGKAKVKVEIGKEKIKFQLDTTEIEAIVGEISTRTGLSTEEIKAIIEVEEHDESESDGEGDSDSSGNGAKGNGKRGNGGESDSSGDGAKGNGKDGNLVGGGAEVDSAGNGNGENGDDSNGGKGDSSSSGSSGSGRNGGSGNGGRDGNGDDD